MADTKQVKCTKCKVPLEGPANPKDEDRFACPSCGAGDSYKNVMAEVREQVTEQLAEDVMKPFRDAARTNKMFKVTSPPRTKRQYQFIIDI